LFIRQNLLTFTQSPAENKPIRAQTPVCIHIETTNVTSLFPGLSATTIV
jgi:hypothetical protein